MKDLVDKLPFRTWRTAEMHHRYETEREADKASGLCPLCGAPTIQEFKYWRIIPNKYPYDSVAKQHDQIIPKRHIIGAELTEEEFKELLELRTGYLNDHYSFMIEALPKDKSIPGHFHLHLMVPKVID